MVSKRLLASCSLVLFDFGKPTAAHCDCSSTYTEQPQLLWTIHVDHMPKLLLLTPKPLFFHLLCCYVVAAIGLQFEMRVLGNVTSNHKDIAYVVQGLM